MTKVIIIEDEKPAARRLQRMLSRLEIEAETMLHSVSEAINWFDANEHPDLIFLDIQLSDGLSFEIFDHIEINSSIIFTTAYDEYALRAFKLNSIDYLLKPIDDEELEAAVKKFRERQGNSQNINVKDLRSLLQLSDNSKSYKSRFTTQVGQHLKLVEVGDISCFYSENKGTYMQCKNGRSYPLDISLENLEPELDPGKFFRINRKCIVNIEAIKDIISYTNSRLELRIDYFDEFQLIVSRERVKDFKIWLDH